MIDVLLIERGVFTPLFLFKFKLKIMCFITANKQKIVNIAKKDIFCFKILEKTPSGSLISPFRTFNWKVGDRNKEDDLRRVADCDGCFIHRGFHSFTTYAAAKLYRRNNGLCTKKTNIYITKIPKGSLYWENDAEYCTDMLVLTSKKPYRLPRVKKS